MHCSCGRCLKPSQSTKKLDKKNFDATSIPGYVIKKEPTPWCQTWSFRAAANVTTRPRIRCRKLANPTMLGTKPFWKDDTTTTKIASLCEIFGGWKSRLFSMTNFYWKITSFFATREERTRNEKNRVLSLNKEGVPGPLNQRPDFVGATRELKRLHDEHVKETTEGNTPIHPTQRTRQRSKQRFEGLEEYNCQIDPRTGWRSYPSKSQGNLRHPTSSSSSTQWEQHDAWKSIKSWNSWRSSSWTEQ